MMAPASSNIDNQKKSDEQEELSTSQINLVQSASSNNFRPTALTEYRNTKEGQIN